MIAVVALFTAFQQGFDSRRFTAGLLIAFIDFLVALGAPERRFASLDEFFLVFPRQEITRNGTKANALIVSRGDSTLSIRRFYDNIEREIRSKHHRLDYPSCAPHATQAWVQHVDWLAQLVTMSESQLLDLRERVLRFVLAALPNQDFDPANARQEPPSFRYLLDGFDVSKHKGERSGAAYQGLVFGFLRADNPHLQVEIRKVRAGSARTQGIGDIDCWDGSALAISAEVKQRIISDANFEPFANEVNRRGALGIIAALDFAGDDTRDQIELLGVRAVSQSDLLRIVELWDPIKQRTAVNSLFYYVEHIEGSSALAARLHAYLEQQTTNVPPDETS